MDIPILGAQTRYECPNCTSWYLDGAFAAQRFHPCPGLNGMLAPGVPEGEDCKVEAVEREDYVGKELVRTDDDGRPIMAVRTERADGSNDLAIFAPTAYIHQHL